MPFQIIRNDITRVKADAIVNTANPRPCIGQGTDSAIYAAAGAAELLAERRQIGDIAPGQAVSTGAYALQAKYLIHTVGPAWIDGHHGEQETLHACYRQSLALAERLQCRSIAFPLIASGIYGFPKEAALNIALAEIGTFLLTHEMDIRLVVLDRKALELSEQLVGSIEQYIDEHAVRQIHQAEYGSEEPGARRWREARRREEAASAPEPAPDFSPVAGRSLEEVVSQPGESFQQYLFRLIDASGLDDVTVYKKANIDRKLFSRIRCKTDYQPKKKTALALAIVLELDLPTTRELLSRAGYAFSVSDRFDLIVGYFITHQNYDIFEINAALFKYGQPILGQ